VRVVAATAETGRVRMVFAQLTSIETADGAAGMNDDAVPIARG
jgi:hypothetical protein